MPKRDLSCELDRSGLSKPGISTNQRKFFYNAGCGYDLICRIARKSNRVLALTISRLIEITVRVRRTNDTPANPNPFLLSSIE
ncbi:hypothetical protein L0152_24845 [bacterium]|nr:hypothetical protein [bacterium]